MKTITLTGKEAKVLAALAVFGFLIPNGVFIYSIFTHPETVKSALTNPISFVFIAEAFFLMFLFAWLLEKAEMKKPSGLVFIIMSLIGGMVFSVPATLYLILTGHHVKE